MSRCCRYLAFSAALALAGCASAPGPNCVRLSASGFFCLLEPAALAPQSGTDLVKVMRRGKTEHYVGQLSVTPARLELALTNLAGVPLATLSWDGSRAQIHASKASKLEPRRLVALLELTLAPPKALRSALHGLEFSQAPTAAGQERRLATGAALVARAVDRRDGTRRIEVPRAGLVIVLRPVGSGR